MHSSFLNSVSSRVMGTNSKPVFGYAKYFIFVLYMCIIYIYIYLYSIDVLYYIIFAKCFIIQWIRTCFWVKPGFIFFLQKPRVCLLLSFYPCCLFVCLLVLVCFVSFSFLLDSLNADMLLDRLSVLKKNKETFVIFS